MSEEDKVIEKSEMRNTKQSQFGYSQYSERSTFLGKDIESQKRRSIKKILLMSSMDKDTMKILLKILQGGLKNLTSENKEKLKKNASNILDKDRQKELDVLLERLESGDDSSDNFLQIIKYYVLSPVEKSYIAKIEQELQKSQQLDDEIKKVQENINEEKKKKLERYREEKDGKAKVNNKETCEALLREVSIHENKLEKANQKLNEIVARNNQLREKINVLRKEKNVIEEIYNKLKKELEEKKKNVEKTIKSAGEAYYNRNRAEEELKALQEKAEQQKLNFEQEYKNLNENIQYDRRFKQFIKSKQKEKEVLENLEKQIQRNQEIIAEKKASNEMIDNEYMLSAKKEEEIKKAFERIKKETGINETKDKESKELLNVFINLYQKNTIMSKFVKELNEEVEELERKIEEKKKEIQMYSTKGATNDNKRREMKIALTNKIQQEEKKKVILKAQYEKSIETINLIKQYLENVFIAIDVEPETIEKLRSAAITEENMVHFLGILEQKGLDAISEYSRLIAEQLKLEKGDMPGLAQNIDDLNNIIAYENANIMNFYSSAGQGKQDCPDDLLQVQNNEDGEDEKIQQIGQRGDKFFSQEELRKQALDVITKKFTQTNPNKANASGVKTKQRTQKQYKTVKN
ncbi:hypothetical protein ABPG74_012448 [Tetrahymena malaccensis]